MSPDVARFLLELLNRQQINIGADDFAAVAELAERAKAELADALRENQQ